MGTPQDPPYPFPPPPFPLPDPDAPPDPDEDEPRPVPLPSVPEGYTLKFVQSPDAEARFAKFVEWLLKIEPNGTPLSESQPLKAKLAPKEE